MIYEYSLDGFHCAACGEKVVREIKRLDYVTDAELNIAPGRILITPENARPSLMTGKATLPRARYEYRKLDAKGCRPTR